MGNPMTKIGASDLSILLNPAIIAVNQDPLGKPAAQRWVRNDQQMWSGQLTSTTGGTTDMVVVLVNLGGSTATISATMSEIFGGSVPAGTWEIRDLWAPRLSTAQAQGILNSGASSNPSLVYNATAKSYQSGLAGNDAKLLGTTIGTVASSGSVSGSVVSHGVKAFRLRLSGTGAGTPSTTAGSTSAGPTTTSAPPSGSSGQLPIYSQCGGTGWTGSGACVSGTTCKFVNDYYSQCL
jgi:alpha-galactosidase